MYVVVVTVADDDDDDDDDDDADGQRRVLVKRSGPVTMSKICRATNSLLCTRTYLPHTPDPTVDLHW